MDIITLAAAKALSGGGGSGGGVLVVREVQHQSEPLVSGTLPNVDGYSYSYSHGEGSLNITVTGVGDMDILSLVVTIGTYTYRGFELNAVDENTLKIALKGEQITASAIAGLNITVTITEFVLDHTWQEIADAHFSIMERNEELGGTSVYTILGYAAGNNETPFMVGFGSVDGSYIYLTTSASGYPVMPKDV